MRNAAYWTNIDAPSRRMTAEINPCLHWIQLAMRGDSDLCQGPAAPTPAASPRWPQSFAPQFPITCVLRLSELSYRCAYDDLDNQIRNRRPRIGRLLMSRTDGARDTRLGSRMSTARPLTKNCSERIKLYRPSPPFARGRKAYLFLSEPLWLLSVPFTWFGGGLTTSFLSFA
jgi:hypothetical protein